MNTPTHPHCVTIEDVSFGLHPDGSLDIGLSHRPMVQMTPHQVYALYCLFHMPGVAELLREQNAVRQIAIWQGIEQS